jgi:hypothetical protein
MTAPGSHRGESTAPPRDQRADLAEGCTAEPATSAERDPANRLRGAIGVAAASAAAFAAFIAYLTNGLLSTGDVGSHETPLLIWQLVVALVGLVPAGLFTWALCTRRDRQARLWLATGIVIYLAWGVLNDASVHGWSHLKGVLTSQHTTSSASASGGPLGD